MQGAPSNQSTFVLVHGAFHGGWCWRRVADRLRADGARVFTPTLTGLADRSHLLRPDIDLTTHIDDVVNLMLWEDAEDVVLCGHSYAGMVISGVAERVPERIKALVYLDALKPQPGDCLWDHLSPSAREDFDKATTRGTILPKAAEVLKVNENDRAWVDSKCTPHPKATMLERLPSTYRRDGIKTNFYVFASEYASPMLARFADEAAADGWIRINMAGGHDLMLDNPGEVADLLRSAAGKPSN